MSRASTSSQRNLTLTEELEKLEQSITLTLQEIDHNFSRAHRIVTTSILPIVEQYAGHSKNVWEGSKFWKQFFEASANVSLSGYEETPPEDETVTEDTTSATTPSSSTYPSPTAHDLSTSTPSTNHNHNPQSANADMSSSFYSPTTHSTPRAPHQPPTLAAYSSPYETLRREVVGTTSPSNSPTPSASDLPSTPRNKPQPSDGDPQSSPFLPPSTTTVAAASHRIPANDVLLHRILDKKYRLQATPHTQSRLPRGTTTAATPLTTRQRRTQQAGPNTTTNTRYAPSSDPDSSPIAPAPEVRADIYGTPGGRRTRVPGVSVLTPARGKEERTGRGREDGGGKKGVWDSDSDEDGDGLPEGMSPPKTMQFYIPQSRLLKTPAREASKRIVEGLLMTAGGDMTGGFAEEDSPSLVKRGGLEEDTF